MVRLERMSDYRGAGLQRFTVHNLYTIFITESQVIYIYYMKLCLI